MKRKIGLIVMACIAVGACGGGAEGERLGETNTATVIAPADIDAAMAEIERERANVQAAKDRLSIAVQNGSGTTQAPVDPVVTDFEAEQKRLDSQLNEQPAR